ncbi:MAG: hypothetical protein NWP87_00250 [Winogradskyella sp.]|nr:hypothetical protein [Winogradskyella sp.]
MKLSNPKVESLTMNQLIKDLNVFKNSIVVLMLIGLITMSCSTKEDEAAEIDNQIDNTLEVKYSTEIDQVDNALGDLIIQIYEAEESDTSGRLTQLRDVPECITMAVIIQQGYRQVTIDFGTEGCMVRGHLLRGQIVFDYTRDSEAQEITINYNLVDFYFDAKNIIASRSILKEKSNENGNPQFTHDLSITVIWPNGMQASREGSRIREWVEGFGTGSFNDNVFEITGNWTATFVNGNTHNYDVILPLRREVGCTYFVSGTFNVQRTNFGGLFDYGDGQCDNQASFTFNNGQVLEITLN